MIITLLPTQFASAKLISLSYVYPEYKSLIGRADSKARLTKVATPYIGITSHHLPTASPLIDRFFAELKSARPKIETFVVIGPDHFENCRKKMVMSDLTIKTMFGDIQTDKKIIHKLKETRLRVENQCFVGEHAVGVPANYIKKYFPEAKIVPILLSNAAKSQNFARMQEVLIKNKAKLFVLESTDFTHYVNVQKAEANDELTKSAILKRDFGSLTLKQVDSPATLRLILELSKKEKLKPVILEHKNSFDFTGQPENTTSYFSVLF